MPPSDDSFTIVCPLLLVLSYFFSIFEYSSFVRFHKAKRLIEGCLFKFFIRLFYNHIQIKIHSNIRSLQIKTPVSDWVGSTDIII